MKNEQNIINQSFRRQIKAGLALLLTVLATLFSGVLNAEASVTALNNWPATPQIVSNAATGTVTGTVTVNAGTRRLMLVAVSSEYTAAPASQTMTVTFGGQTVRQIQQIRTGSNTMWLGLCDQTDLTNATSATLSVTNSMTTGLTAMYASAAVFEGVSQQSPVTGSSIVSTTAVATATSLLLPNFAVTGAAGNTGLSVFVNAWNGQIPNTITGYTAIKYAGTNFNISYNTVTTAYTARNAAVSITATSPVATQGSAVAVGLNPDGILGSALTSCGGCHGNPPVDNATRVGGLFPGSHAKHTTTNGFACTFCHINNAAINHSNGFKNISGSRLPRTVYSTGQPTAVGTGSFGSCSNYCHSMGTSRTSNPGETRNGAPTSASTLTWSVSTSNCGSCHGNPPGYANLATTWGAAKANNHVAHVTTSGYTCDVCHNRTTTNGTTIASGARHANGFYNISANTAKTMAFTYTYAPGGGSCSSTSCHGGSVMVWGTTLPGATCAKCHSDTTAMASFTITAGTNNTARSTIHASHLNMTRGYKTVKLVCADCHSVPASPSTDGHNNNALPADVLMSIPLADNGLPTAPAFNPVVGGACSNVWCHGAGLSSNISSPQPGLVLAPTFATTLLNSNPANDCTRCHGYPPGSPTHTGMLPANCKGCHVHVNAAGTGFDDLTKHINGIIETPSCTVCHSNVQGGRRVAVMAQFTSSRNSHHYQGAAPINGQVCYACHWEADSTGNATAYHRSQTAGFKNKVQLVVWGASTIRPDTYTPGVTYVLYSSGGVNASTRAEMAKINTHCLGCHNETNKTTAPFTGDSGTPSKYSWEALATTKGGLGSTAQSIDIKYSSTTTTAWGKFTGNYTNTKSRQRKAYSGHGNAAVNRRGWSTLEENAQGLAAPTFNNYSNTSGAVQVLCFDCHNSHGSATTAPANAVTTSYSSATGRGRGGILKNTIAGQGGYAVAYRPYSGGNVTQKNVYKAGAGICYDCHNNQVSTLVSAGTGTTPWGYGTPFSSTQNIHGYYDTPYFGKAGTTFPKIQTYPYIATGRTPNLGGHFGASSPLTTSTNNNLKVGGLCTPCHDPHGVSPGLAPNQALSVPMLKGTFMTSPYKHDAAPLANVSRGGGSQAATATTTGAVGGYHIDQNTMQVATTGLPATALRWSFTNATTLSKTTVTNENQFAGLCMKCHNKASLNSTDPAEAAAGAGAGAWKKMTRIHNSVRGWALTTGSGGNIRNIRHAYTCSKCHTSHNANLPRLLVTNCLDAKHKGRVQNVTPTNAIIGPFSGSGGSGNGLGRFPGGGAASGVGSQNSSQHGPWFFGTQGVAATQACHDSATAGGTFDPAGASQLWNTKTPW